jgi:hypothetical protein
MPYAMRYDPERRWFVTRFHGRVTADDVVQQYLEALDSAFWDRHEGRIAEIEHGSDLSEMTIEVFRERFEPVLRHHADRAGRIRKSCWIVASELSKTIVKVYEFVAAKSGLEDFRLFETRHDAEDWLSESVY